jgi:hypothetical protein
MQFSNFGNLTNFQRSASREKLNQFAAMQQHHHVQFNQQNHVPSYRHSLNSLMPFNVQQQHQQQNRRNSSCGTDRITFNTSMPSPFGSSEKILSEQVMSKSTSPNLLGSTTALPPTTNTSDINSRLESLCRQMTEQAIN